MFANPAILVTPTACFAKPRILTIKAEIPVSLVNRADRVGSSGVSVVRAYRSVLFFSLGSNSNILRLSVSMAC